MSWKNTDSQCMPMILIPSQVRDHCPPCQRQETNSLHLDGQERTWMSSVLMICDGEKAVGIAGIMGGENSMITDDVRAFYLKQHALMEPISVLPARNSVFVPMHQVNSKRVWIRIMQGSHRPCLPADRRIRSRRSCWRSR